MIRDLRFDSSFDIDIGMRFDACFDSIRDSGFDARFNLNILYFPNTPLLWSVWNGVFGPRSCGAENFDARSFARKLPSLHDSEKIALQRISRFPTVK